MNDLDMRDVALQSVTPTVMVPRFSNLEPLSAHGHRFLMAGDGLWYEVMSPWLHLRHPLAKQGTVSMPYGAVEPAIDFGFTIPVDLVMRFVEVARERCPNECAAWIVWSERDGGLDLRLLEEISVGRGHVKFHRPALGEYEHMVVDLHSHGHLPAFFSAMDDRDDRGEVKIAGVVGSVDTKPSFAFRLCVNGLFIPIMPPEEVAAVEDDRT